ncbi:MAG: PIN domain-containing protein [Anaerolineae bacterium]|nr:PIN domain-containing protein [Anaerolineae bacterium]MCO5205657.1 PIN domain-containing protein [Anaerolineae bacterium]
MIRAVIDTNVVFEGLTRREGVSTLILRAWHAGIFQACVSLAVQYEYYDVLSRKLAPDRWVRVQPVLGTLLTKARPVIPHYRWRPSSPDPADEFVIDCAMNARAWIVTYNERDFTLAQFELGLMVLSPQAFLTELAHA